MGRLGKWGLAGVAAGSIVGMASGAIAQVPSPADMDAITRNQQQILNQDEVRRKDEERRRKLREMTPPPPQEETQQRRGDQGARCVDVEALSIAKNDILSTQDAEDLLKGFKGRCLAASDIEALLQGLNDRLRDAGYITTRAYLRPQSLQQKTLEITIIEGEIGDIRLNENAIGDKTQLFFAFPSSKGDILNLRDIEQGLDQMNRLASNNAKMEISPGDEAGTSVVTITNQAEKPIRLTIGRDSSGSTSTGKLQNTATLNIDNLMRINDAWTINYNRTARQYGIARRSESISGTYSVPLGYSTLTYSGSYYDYSTRVEGNIQDFQTSGISSSHKIEFSNVVHRDSNSKTRVDVSLTAKKTRNFIEDVVISSSSRKLSVGRIAAAHSTRLFDGVMSAELGFERGLRVLGARLDDPSQPTDDPKAQFRKWTLEGNYQRPFELGDSRFAWTSSTSWQYTPDTLFGTERLNVGGQYSVRGFRDDTLSGDIGGYWRNEVAWTPDLGLSEPVAYVVKTIEPYAAYDWGWIKKDGSETRERGTLSGVAFGLRTNGTYFSTNAEWAYGLHSPEFLKKNGHEINFRAVFHL